MRLLYVPLDGEELERLRDMAAAEKRRPQDQAAYLITQALRQPAARDQAITEPEEVASAAAR